MTVELGAVLIVAALPGCDYGHDISYLQLYGCPECGAPVCCQICCQNETARKNSIEWCEPEERK